MDTTPPPPPPPPPAPHLVSIGFSEETLNRLSLTYPHRIAEFEVTGTFSDGSTAPVTPTFSVRARPDLSFIGNSLEIPNNPGDSLLVDATLVPAGSTEALTASMMVRVGHYEIVIGAFRGTRVPLDGIVHTPTEEGYVLVDTVTAYATIDGESKELADETYSLRLLNAAELGGLYPPDPTMLNPRAEWTWVGETFSFDFRFDYHIVEGEGFMRYPVMDPHPVFGLARIEICIETTPDVAGGAYRLPDGQKVCVTVDGTAEAQN